MRPVHHDSCPLRRPLWAQPQMYGPWSEGTESRLCAAKWGKHPPMTLQGSRLGESVHRRLLALPVLPPTRPHDFLPVPMSPFPAAAGTRSPAQLGAFTARTPRTDWRPEDSIQEQQKADPTNRVEPQPSCAIALDWLDRLERRSENPPFGNPLVSRIVSVSSVSMWAGRSSMSSGRPAAIR